MRQFLQLALLLILSFPCLGQPVGREHSIAIDIRERLQTAEDLRSENHADRAISLLEGITSDSRLQSDPILRSHVYYDLARAYASSGKSDQGITALRQAVLGGGISYRDLDRETDFDGLRRDRSFVALLEELTAHQRPWESLWSVPAAFRDKEGELTEDLKVAGLSTLWAEAKQNFVYFDRVPGLDWDSAYMAFLPRVRRARGAVEYYQLLQQMCALLRDGHTTVDYPREVRDSLLFRPAIDLRLIGETVLVEGVHDGDLAAIGIVPGLEVVSVDGLPVHQYAERFVVPYQTGSTPQDIRVRAYEYRLFSGSCSRPVTIEFRSREGATIKRRVDRNFSEEDLHWTRQASRSDTLVSNIGYLDLATFYDEYLVRQVRQRLADLGSTDALIIDLRENGGGYTDIALQVLALFIDSSFATHMWETPSYSPFARFSNAPLQWLRQSAGRWPGTLSNAYRKPVVVLTSPRTYSAAEHFLVSFRQAGRGLTVGEVTGGSSGHALELSLPGGGALFINTTRDYFPDGRRFNGTGIVADLPVKPTVDDIRNGRDPVLATAIDHLQRELGRSSGVPIVAALEGRQISVPEPMPGSLRRGRRGSYTAVDTVRNAR